MISPSAASLIRNKPKVSEDFPAPVLPTIPICWEKNTGITHSGEESKHFQASM